MTDIPSVPEPAADATRVGRAVSARWTRRRAGRDAGAVASQLSRFAWSVGRSAAARRMIGTNVPSLDASGLPARPPAAAWQMREAASDDQVDTVLPHDLANLRRLMRTQQQRRLNVQADLPPRTLPLASMLGVSSPAGQRTGPRAARHRYVPRVAAVDRLPDVAAASPVANPIAPVAPAAAGVAGGPVTTRSSAAPQAGTGHARSEPAPVSDGMDNLRQLLATRQAAEREGNSGDAGGGRAGGAAGRQADEPGPPGPAALSRGTPTSSSPDAGSPAPEPTGTPSTPSTAAPGPEIAARPGTTTAGATGPVRPPTSAVEGAIAATRALAAGADGAAAGGMPLATLLPLARRHAAFRAVDRRSPRHVVPADPSSVLPPATAVNRTMAPLATDRPVTPAAPGARLAPAGPAAPGRGNVIPFPSATALDVGQPPAAAVPAATTPPAPSHGIAEGAGAAERPEVAAPDAGTPAPPRWPHWPAFEAAAPAMHLPSPPSAGAPDAPAGTTDTAVRAPAAAIARRLDPARPASPPSSPAATSWPTSTASPPSARQLTHAAPAHAGHVGRATPRWPNWPVRTGAPSSLPRLPGLAAPGRPDAAPSPAPSPATGAPPHRPDGTPGHVASGTGAAPVRPPVPGTAPDAAPPGPAEPGTTTSTSGWTPAAAQPPAGGATAADRFTRTLAAHRPDPLQDLPAPYAPLTKALAGGRRVKVSTGPASRAALAAAGHKAATVGTTIHLPTALTTSPEHVDIVSHELTHVGAAPTRTTPRFYDDEKHDAEESQARATGRAVGSLAREAEDRKDASDGPGWSVGTAGLPVGGATNLFQALSAAPAGATGGRSAIGSHRAPGTSTPTTPGAPGGPAGTTTSSSSGGAGLGSLAPAASGPGAAEAPAPTPHAAGGWAPAAPATGGAIGDASFRPRRPDELGTPGSLPLGVLDSTVRSGTVLDEAEIRRIVALIERRVLAELERHGRRGPGLGGTW